MHMHMHTLMHAHAWQGRTRRGEAGRWGYMIHDTYMAHNHQTGTLFVHMQASTATTTATTSTKTEQVSISLEDLRASIETASSDAIRAVGVAMVIEME